MKRLRRLPGVDLPQAAIRPYVGHSAGPDINANFTSELVSDAGPKLRRIIDRILAEQSSSQAALARSIGVSPSVLSRMKSGRLKRMSEKSVQALIRMVRGPADRKLLRQLFIRRDLRNALKEMRRDRNEWCIHYRNAARAIDLRRPIPMKNPPGIRLVPGAEPGSRHQWNKEFAALRARAELLVKHEYGVGPLLLLAGEDSIEPLFQDSLDSERSEKSLRARIAAARWIRILDPLLVAPSSSYIDPHWRDLTNKAFLDFIHFGIQRELILLNNSPLLSPPHPLESVDS